VLPARICSEVRPVRLCLARSRVRRSAIAQFIECGSCYRCDCWRKNLLKNCRKRPGLRVVARNHVRKVLRPFPLPVQSNFYW
jgi:hypothetical protein